MTHKLKKVVLNLFETKAGRIALFIWRPGQGIKVHLMISLVITCLAPLKAGTTGKKSPVQLVQDLKSFQLYLIVIVFFLNPEKTTRLDFILGFVFKNYLFLMQFYLWHKPKAKDYQT